jgi:hypothetical protein
MLKKQQKNNQGEVNIRSPLTFKGIVSRDLMRKKACRWFYWIDNKSYIFPDWVLFLILKSSSYLKFSKLEAQPLYLWGAHASGSLHVPVSKVLSMMLGTARSVQHERASQGALLPPGHGGLP